MCQKAKNRFHAWSTCVYVVRVTTYAPEHARLRLTRAVCDPLRPRIASDPTGFRFGLLEALLAMDAFLASGWTLDDPGVVARSFCSQRCQAVHRFAT
jgi:hypothetical protein